ncbi:MAG: peptidase, partial [Verrucomicrobiales bacterium]|nr:peptidase [Verrucomicrobiales bacterium]
DSPPPVSFSSMSPQDIRDLSRARALLEEENLAVRLTSKLGVPLEKGMKLLPQGFMKVVNRATELALTKALDVAVHSLAGKGSRTPSNNLHKSMVAVSGAVGGAFGLASLPIELPISTSVMLRSIAEIARHEGHDLSKIETRLECLQVFAFGEGGNDGNLKNSRYWLTRSALGRALAEATSYIVERGAVDATAGPVARLVSSIAARFGLVVSEEVAAKAVPIIGAASGSMINLLFIHHFQAIAEGHFIVRRLEKKYGAELVRSFYQTEVSVPPPHLR